MSFLKFSKAQNITNFIEIELNKLNIFHKVVSITTDNESAAAGSNININLKRISCMCHNLNLAVKNGLKLWIKPKYIVNEDCCQLKKTKNTKKKKKKKKEGIPRKTRKKKKKKKKNLK